MFSLNEQVADKLREAADLLEQQEANPFRVGAFRHAAETVAHLESDIQAVVEDKGLDGLVTLPNIGRGIASAIFELVATGRWGRLERLRGDLDPMKLFRTVPGIGPELAERIQNTLHVDTLEALEAAAHDGRLESVPGLGRRRVAAVRAELASMLGRVRHRQDTFADGPPLGHLLRVDGEYRAGATAERLPTIAPKRFNPEGTAWLPVLHTEHGDWHFTAMYSNTARAHELGHTRDWVVIYFYDDHHREGQHTVVTETRGPLMGKRVVRGREVQCREYYNRDS